MFVNKIKIIRTGGNRTVKNTLEPFYLLEPEWPLTDNQITGAKNLIDHYGLKNAYQKYFRGNLKEELSGFLTHLSGNVNTPSSSDESGLMHLIERPPIQGNSFQTFNISQLDSAVRLHPGPLPQEFMSYFVAPSLTPNTTNNGPSSNEVGSIPSIKKRRRDAHRSGVGGVASSDYAPASSFSHFPSSNPASAIMRGQQQPSVHHTSSQHHHPSSVAMAPHSGPLMNPSIAASLSSGVNKPATSVGYFVTPPPAVKRPLDEPYNSLTPSGMASSVESPGGGGYDFDDEIRRKRRRKEKKSSGSSSRRDRIE
nr:Mediator of RNA polymerase II transcription [Hymenolepis microstoma]